MYYLIEHRYVGSWKDDLIADADAITIRTIPAEKDGQPCTEGACDASEDWEKTAHGEYDSLEAAREAMARIFGKVRDQDEAGQPFEHHGEGIVAVYHPGEFKPMSSSEANHYLLDQANYVIDKDTTDEEIAELVKEYEQEANQDGLTLGDFAKNIFEAVRSERQCYDIPDNGTPAPAGSHPAQE